MYVVVFLSRCTSSWYMSALRTIKKKDVGMDKLCYQTWPLGWCGSWINKIENMTTMGIQSETSSHGRDEKRWIDGTLRRIIGLVLDRCDELLKQKIGALLLLLGFFCLATRWWWHAGCRCAGRFRFWTRMSAELGSFNPWKDIGR